MKQFLTVLWLVLMYTGVNACDACACTSMNSLDGQLLPSNKSFIGLNSGYVHQLDASKQRINNSSFGLFAAISYAKRWQILASLPVQYNVLVPANDKKSSQFGLGDASLVLSVMPYATPMEKQRASKSTIVLRGGLKMPTGYYDKDNMQTANLGTKSWDFVLSAQYIFERNDQGMNAVFNTRINTTNPYDYSFGNKYDISAFYFVKRKQKNHSYMPFVGLAGEWIDIDKSNGFYREQSGGKALYGMGGLLWNINEKFSLYAKGELPVVQDYLSQDGNVYTNIRAQVQLTYFIPKNKKPDKYLKLE